MAFQIFNKMTSLKMVKSAPEIIPTYTPNTLIISYSMDNNTNNTGTAGARYNGTLVGSASFNSTYKKRGTHSLYTSGTGSSVSVPKIYLTNGTNSNGFTVCLWILKPVIAGTGDVLVFGTGANQFKINVYGGDAAGNYNVYFNVGSKQILTIAVGIGLDNNNWRFFAFTLTNNGTSSTATSYGYNSTGYNYGQTNSTFTYPTAAFTNNIIGNANVYLDDIRIYNYVLTRTNIDAIFNGTF